MNMLEYILSLAIFMLIQSFAINGLHYAFKVEFVKEGNEMKIKMNILAPVARWISLRKGKFWLFVRKPIYECIRCMASVWGIITFLPTVIYLFGVHLWILPLLIFDILVLVSLNWFIYKRL